MIYIFPWGTILLRDVRCREIVDEKVEAVVAIVAAGEEEWEAAGVMDELMNSSVICEPGSSIDIIPGFAARCCDRGS
jgi:hypothetical protein